MFVPPLIHQPLKPDDYLTVCGKCGHSSEDHVKCDRCGFQLPAETLPVPDGTSTLAPRPSIRSQSSPAPPSLLISKSFYGPASGCRSQQLEIVMNPPMRITRGNMLVSPNGRLLSGSGNLASNGHKQVGGKILQITKPCELNDPSKCTRLLKATNCQFNYLSSVPYTIYSSLLSSNTSG